nr:glycosyltransferase family 39 protein [Planosporangium thailandense]
MVEALSARIFGFSTWSVLLPQVVETVVTLLVLYGVVRRWIGPTAGILAAAAFATTPIVAALSHAEISDTLLTMLLVLAADATQRAVAGGRLRWLLLAGVWVGLAFQAKMVEAWGILPALALAYLVAAPGTVRRPLGHVGLAGLVTLAVSLSWIVMVLLTPASARPYIDGSTDNSPLSMVFDYNLFNRYGLNTDTAVGFGRHGGAVASYMLGADVASQVGWLYPLAVIGLVCGIWWRGRTPRTDAVRAGFLLFGGWLAVYTAAFSTGRVAHTYYVVAVAPAVAALAGGGTVTLWQAYRRPGRRRWLLPATVAVSIGWAAYLSGQYPSFLPWLTPLLVSLGAVGVILLVVTTLMQGVAGHGTPRGGRRARIAAVAMAATVGALAVAPTAWAASTDDSRYAGSGGGPSAGPARGFGFGPARGGTGGADRDRRYGLAAGAGGAGGFDGDRRGGTFERSGMWGTPDGGRAAGRGQAPGAWSGRSGRGGFGGVSDRPSAQTERLVAYLKSHQPGSRYLVATQGSMQAGPLILAGASVLPMGGFSGQVPFPTTDQLAKLVAAGQARYVLEGGGFGRRGNSATTTWVTGNCKPVNAPALDVSGLYDCARAG